MQVFDLWFVTSVYAVWWRIHDLSRCEWRWGGHWWACSAAATCNASGPENSGL